MSVLVDMVKCRENSDGPGDDIYLITFRGRTVAPFETNISIKSLGSFETGDSNRADRVIAAFQSDAVYVVMLVEKDDDRDIAGDEVVGMWKAQTDLVWKGTMLSQLASGQFPPNDAQKSAAATAIGHIMNGLSSVYMSFPKGNDDIIGGPKRLRASRAEKTVISFVSPPEKEDARYEITFKVT